MTRMLDSIPIRIHIIITIYYIRYLLFFFRVQAAYMIVDEMHEEHPELLKDQYWDEVVPKDLPYTVASEHYRREEPKGSADCYKVKESDSLYANMAPMHHMHRKTAVPEDVYADYVSTI